MLGVSRLHLHECRNFSTSKCPFCAARQETPARVAAQNGHLEVLKFLRDTVSEIGVQSLHEAIKNNQLEVVEFLAGCMDVNAPAQGSDGSMEALKRAGAVAGPQLKLQGLTALRPPVAPPHGAIWFTSGTPELAQSSGKFYYEIEIVSDFQWPLCGWLPQCLSAGSSCPVCLLQFSPYIPLVMSAKIPHSLLNSQFLMTSPPIKFKLVMSLVLTSTQILE